jgi:hypothetical protein
MPNVPFVPGVYEPDKTIAQMILQSGNQRAQMQQQMFGQLANTVGQLGEIPGQIQRQKLEEARTAREESMARRQEAITAAQLAGMQKEQQEEAQMAEAFADIGKPGFDPNVAASKLPPGKRVAFLENYEKATAASTRRRDAEGEEIARIAAGVKSHLDDPDGGLGAAQIALRLATNRGVRGVSEIEGMLKENPQGLPQIIDQLIAQSPAVSKELREASKPVPVPEHGLYDPSTRKMVVEGQPKIDNRSLEARLAAAVPGSPEAKQILETMRLQTAATHPPKEPDTKAAEKAAARAEAIDAAATSIESGQPAASVPMAIRAEAANEARRRGARVYSSDKQKTAVTALESIKKDADKVRELLDDKEIQGYLGKFATSITSTLQEWPLIGQAVPGMGEGVPDKVRQTISLLGDLTDRRLRERSGASINKDEVERISKFSLGSGLSVRTLQLNAKKLAEELNGKIEAEVGTPKTSTGNAGRFKVELDTTP